MHAIVIILGLLVSASVARANTVVVLAPPGDAGGDLGDALRVVLAGRGTGVATAPAPGGQLRIDRAAAAQRVAVERGADAAVWLDETEVCAVTSDGHDFRHAPFPMEAASPRAFAAIAASLLDEMIAPPTWANGLSIDVHVDVSPAAAPPGIVTFAPADRAPRRARDGRMLIEVGPMVSPITAGIEGGVALPLSPSWRIAGMAAVALGFDPRHTLVGAGALELRHVGGGVRRHWDVGPLIGYAAPDGDDSIAIAGARLAHTWERQQSALSVSLTPLVYVYTEGFHSSVFPGIWGSVRWQFAL